MIPGKLWEHYSEKLKQFEVDVVNINYKEILKNISVKQGKNNRNLRTLKKYMKVNFQENILMKAIFGRIDEKLYGYFK